MFKDQELNQKQAEAVNHQNGPLLIAAGAGSGKTKTLVNRLIHLLGSGVAPEKIIAITFTNKAAKEMRDRVGAALNAEKATVKNNIAYRRYKILSAVAAANAASACPEGIELRAHSVEKKLNP